MSNSNEQSHLVPYGHYGNCNVRKEYPYTNNVIQMAHDQYTFDGLEVSIKNAISEYERTASDPPSRSHDENRYRNHYTYTYEHDYEKTTTICIEEDFRSGAAYKKSMNYLFHYIIHNNYSGNKITTLIFDYFKLKRSRDRLQSANKGLKLLCSFLERDDTGLADIHFGDYCDFATAWRAINILQSLSMN
jgi:hypothetical protein